MKDLDRYISRRNQDILNLADQRAEDDREREESGVDETEDTKWECTICGRVGTVGRCCGLETRRPLNEPARKEVDETEDPNFPSPSVQAAAAMIWPRKNFPSLTAWIDYVKKWWPKVPAMTAILDQHKPS